MFVAVLTVIRLAIYPVLKNTPAHKRTGVFPLARFLNEVLDAFIYAGVFVFMLIRPFAVQAFLIPSGSMFPTLYVNDFIVANKAVFRYTDPKVGDIVVFRPPIAACGKDQIGPDGQAKVDFIKRCLGAPGDLVEIKDGVLYRNGAAAKDTWAHFSRRITEEQFEEVAPNSTSDAKMPDFKIVHYTGPYGLWKDKYIPVITQPGNPDPNFFPGGSVAYTIGVSSSNDSNSPFAQSLVNTQDLTQEDKDRIEYLRQAPAAKIPPGFYLMVGDNRNGSFDGRYWGLVPRESIIGRSEFIWLPFNRWSVTR